jgi:hypothetical protein
VFVTRIPRLRACSRSTASVPTPLIAMIATFGSWSTMSRLTPVAPPVTIARTRGAMEARNAVFSGISDRRCTV